MGSAVCSLGPSEATAEPATSLTFRTAFEQNVGYAWRTLRRLGVPEADIEDVCQEVFLIVHRRWADYDGTAAMRTWIYGICIRVASEYRRRRRRQQAQLGVMEDSVPAPQEAALLARDALSHLELTLNQLDEEQRAVFVLFHIERIPMVEVAAAVGCPLQTAYCRLYAARKKVEASFRRREA